MIRELPKSLNVRIHKVPITVPVVESQAVTEALVAQLSERLATIEEEAERVDTQAFAIRAAFDYLVELHQIRQENERDQKELMVALSALTDRLHALSAQALE